MFIYIFEDLKILKNEKKYSSFIKQGKKSHYIMKENKKYNFQYNNNVIKYTEYKSDLISINHDVLILNIDDGINIIFNEKGIGLIESFCQLSNTNIENIFKTLIEYKNQNLIFILE